MNKLIASILLSAGFYSAVQAQTVYVQSLSVSTNWSSTAIWTPAGPPGTGVAKDDIVIWCRNVNAAGSKTITNDTSISLGGLYLGCTGVSNGRMTLTPAGGSTITFTNTTGGSAFIIKTNNISNTAVGMDVINTPIILGSNLSVSNLSSYGMLEIAGVISDLGQARSVTVGNISTGAVFFTAATNTYSGGTILNTGKLTVDKKDELGTGLVTINNGGEATFNLSNTTMSNNIVNNGALIVGGNAGLSGSISGNGSIYHNSSAGFTLNLSGDNSSFSGTITNAGTMKFSNAKSLGTAKIVLGDGVNTGSFGLNVTTNATGANAVKNNITLIGNGNTIGNNISTLELTGVISGAYDLTKGGTSTVIFSGTNTYSGATAVVSTGTLVGNTDHAFGATTNITVAGGAALTLQNGVLNNYINDAATLVLTNGAVLNLSFSGKDIIAGISLNGGATWLPKGTYNAATLTSGGVTCTGSGSLKVGKDVLRLISITSP